ncbi:MAG TPA: ATPase domain-containing protein [Polyangiaceae bacterium]|nr:ATPase domain-containing protein [Polyangiaceae bacterium]
MPAKGRPRRSRVATHIPGLDTVLCGGLLRGGIYVVRGAPGSGKTILGNQICFANARQGGSSAYVTLLAESHARMMLHLESIEFFEAELVGERMRYLSAYSALMKNGLRGVLDFIRAELPPKKGSGGRGASAEAANIIIIDGFLVISDSSSSVSELKKFIQDLQLYADLVGATVILLAGPAVDESRPEYTMVDGIIELREHVHDLRAYRELRVRKLRGVAHLRGGHMFDITSRGVTVYPRIESLYGTPSGEDHCEDATVSSGITQLDMMLGGGLKCGTTTLVLGPSGAGKTTLGLHYLAATPRKSRSVLFGFYETPARLLEKARKLNLSLDTRIKRGELEIVWQPSTEQNVDALAERLLQAIANTGATRLFIDGLDGFQRATIHPERVHHVFTAIANELRVRGVTTMYTFEVPKFIGPGLDTPVTGVSSLAENLIYLRFVELRSHLYRLLSVLKVRDSSYDTSLREFHVTNHGIRLEKTFESAEAILTGTAIMR